MEKGEWERGIKIRKLGILMAINAVVFDLWIHKKRMCSILPFVMSITPN
jgi:hypothetical protein